tara:strand:- start:164 stop:454 length:291 start_codon:yes stop_codon:yes gene_type:complete
MSGSLLVFFRLGEDSSGSGNVGGSSANVNDPNASVNEHSVNEHSFNEHSFNEHSVNEHSGVAGKSNEASRFDFEAIVVLAQVTNVPSLLETKTERR